MNFFDNNRNKKSYLNRHNNTNYQKKRLDKRDLPENNQFYCEVCDRGFKTYEKFDEHCQSHETVKINTCLLIFI